MSNTALNKTNLVALGAETLADLLLEVTKGNAALQRRARLELSAQQGPQDVARDLRKRFASIRRATSYVSARKQQVLAKELADMLAQIFARVAPTAPDDAFDLLWAFLHLAEGIYSRTDDSNGRFSTVMRDAMEALETLAPNLSQPPETLAEMVFEAVQDDGYGAFDGAIPALAKPLGTVGLDHLKTLAQGAQDQHRSLILRAVADLQGDVDAYMAQYTPQQLTYHTIAPKVAARLLKAGRAPAALTLVADARDKLRARPNAHGNAALDDAYLDCLAALGRETDAQAFLWESFCRTLNPDYLRRHLAALPDFDDVEAEDRARKIALNHPDPMQALVFLLGWPDLATAARLVETQAAALDGDRYEVLAPAADALEANHPLAATLMRRAMITWTLQKSRAKRYGYAARHLRDCAAADARISGYGSHPDHASYLDALEKDHPRKYGFWALAAFGE